MISSSSQTDNFGIISNATVKINNSGVNHLYESFKSKIGNKRYDTLKNPK